MAYDVTYNADFNILVTITAPLFKSTDPNIKLDTNATLSLANLVASHINRVYETVPTKIGAATVRLDRAYDSAPIQEFTKEKVANGYIYSVRFKEPTLPLSYVTQQTIQEIGCANLTLDWECPITLCMK